MVVSGPQRTNLQVAIVLVSVHHCGVEWYARSMVVPQHGNGTVKSNPDAQLKEDVCILGANIADDEVGLLKVFNYFGLDDVGAIAGRRFAHTQPPRPLV
jgi:hypothetical protein